MSENQKVVVVSEKTTKTRVAEKLGQVGLVVGSTALTTMANAAEIDTIAAGLSDELTAAKAIIISLFAVGAVVLGIFAGYRYMKRGANSA